MKFKPSSHSGALTNGSGVSSAVGSSIAEEIDESKGKGIDFKQIAMAITTGVLVSVGTQLTLDWIRGRGVWDGKGSVFDRWSTKVKKLEPTPFLDE